MAEDPGQGKDLQSLEVGRRESFALVELAEDGEEDRVVGSGTAGHCTIETLDFRNHEHLLDPGRRPGRHPIVRRLAGPAR